MQIFLPLVRSINFDFNMFSVNLLVTSHECTFLISTFASICNFSMFVDSKLKKVLSANMVTENFVAFGKSLIKIRNKRVPRTDPCGTTSFQILRSVS